MMTLCLIQSLFLIAAVILTAWYRPTWLKSLAAGIARFADAMQAFRSVINAPDTIRVSRASREASRKAPAPIALTAVQQDVLDALVSLGAKEKEAHGSVVRAIQDCGPEAGFDELFRKASVAA